jgi:hypothetical protein
MCSVRMRVVTTDYKVTWHSAFHTVRSLQAQAQLTLPSLRCAIATDRQVFSVETIRNEFQALKSRCYAFCLYLDDAWQLVHAIYGSVFPLT